MPIKTTTFDAAKYLDTPESQAELDRRCAGERQRRLSGSRDRRGRAGQGMSEVAKDAGVTPRRAWRKALSTEGDPKFSTFLGVIRSSWSSKA